MRNLLILHAIDLLSLSSQRNLLPTQCNYRIKYVEGRSSELSLQQMYAARFVLKLLCFGDLHNRCPDIEAVLYDRGPSSRLR